MHVFILCSDVHQTFIVMKERAAKMRTDPHMGIFFSFPIQSFTMLKLNRNHSHIAKYTRYDLLQPTVTIQKYIHVRLTNQNVS